MQLGTQTESNPAAMPLHGLAPTLIDATGVSIEPAAVYAAQATEVLLDAIARSDGTRASVVDQLFQTRIADGLLGSFGFDENGDISESPVTILRVARTAEAGALGFEGGVVESIVRPGPSLVGPDE